MPVNQPSLDKPETDDLEVGSLEVPARKRPKNAPLDRDAFMSALARGLTEKEIDVQSFGRVLIGELSGDDRAKIMNADAKYLAFGSDGSLSGMMDIAQHQRQVLLVGVLDPDSPPGARTPLLHPGDIDAVMRKLGGSKVKFIVDEIEVLSGLGAGGISSAEGNSAATPSGAGTSG